MANTIRHKRKTGAGATPAAGDLSDGELAINTTDGRLFAKNAAGTVVNLPVSSISGQAITPASIAAGASNASPVATLDVKGDGATSSTASLAARNSAGTSLLHVRDNGTVGLGTTSPEGILTLNGTGGANIGGSLGLGSAMFLKNNSGDNTFQTIAFTDGSSGAVCGITANKTASGGYIYSAGDMVFWTGTYATERFRINNAGNAIFQGNVGLGVTPTYKLHVSGASYFDGTARVTGDLTLDNDLSWTITTLAHGDGPRTNTSPMSIRLFDQYAGAGWPAGYGSVIEVYGRSGHEADQLFFGSDKRLRHRSAFYGETAWSSWRTFLTDLDNVQTSGAGPHYFSAGNLGVGNTSPGSRLVVKGSGTSSAASAVNVTDSADASLLFVRNDGRVGVGTSSPDEKLHVAGNAKVIGDLSATGAISWFPAASATPSSNGQIVVEKTSDTTLTFKVKGSDGTVRSGAITLS